MTTITINERTKAGKTLLELANLLATSNEGVIINIGSDKPSVKKLSIKEQQFLTNLRKVARDVKQNSGKKEYQSLETFLDEI